ncbi:MAG TPA: YceI family protein [Flavisolibacter sp.]|nr:YceI family protein [Flavisolibacter sp.]
MKCKTVLFATLTLFAIAAHAQDKFYSKNASIRFYSKAPLEDIEARHRSAVCVLDIKTGSLQFTTLIKGFEFENKEMQEHFNDHYLESDKFPKSEFKGIIMNNTAVNYKKQGTYPVQVKGSLTIHGVTKEVQTNGTIEVTPNNISTNALFKVQVADYGITIPSLVKDKIAKTVEISVAAKLDALK